MSKEERDGLVDLVEFLVKTDKKYDAKLNTEMRALDKDGEEVRPDLAYPTTVKFLIDIFFV